ncbi:replication initiator protein A [Acetobacter fallax]|uniref:RepB family plasmid replication initiator protein n=1 Tax=Acetobacter fallax TaxID=1737473 RepID=A0ABX0KHY0_9PROT|nr:replication initiator protein A [Acetobacter fallax]NHO33512.1 RepB family plasmid replication initiator protein [Acetobacter fallax]NHO37145.1 RepB family plasmid replication initiator protein [Acetobacter fallax]
MAGDEADLFVDSLVGAPLKDDRALMEFPFFSIQKQPRMEPLIYDDGRTQITIEPGPKGLATIWDKDVLLYVVSLINERIERGMDVDHTVRFAAHDLLRVTGRGTGKRSYELLLDALFRLRSTNIMTSIESADERDRRGFGWIETWRVVERKTSTGRKIMAAIEITLNDWMFRALVKERRVLTINPTYFDLESGLGRRLYEIGRKHLGNQDIWRISLEKLAKKIGTSRELRFFKRDLLKIIQNDVIPDYTLSLEVGPRGGRPVVIFEHRESDHTFIPG